MDLVRRILLDVESLPLVQDGVYGMASVDPDLFAHNMRLIHEYGLARADIFNAYQEGACYLNVSLTWAGSEFLDTVRDEVVWQKTKEGVAQAGGFTFDLVKALAKGFVKKQIETRTGVELDL